MKNWTKRFALLAVLCAIAGGTVLTGCGGGGEEDGGTPAATPTEKADSGE